MLTEIMTVCGYIAVFFILAVLVVKLIRVVVAADKREDQLLEKMFPLLCEKRKREEKSHAKKQSGINAD